MPTIDLGYDLGQIEIVEQPTSLGPGVGTFRCEPAAAEQPTGAIRNLLASTDFLANTRCRQTDLDASFGNANSDHPGDTADIETGADVKRLAVSRNDDKGPQTRGDIDEDLPLFK